MWTPICAGPTGPVGGCSAGTIPPYYWATLRLPRNVRPAVHALYGFVRGADQLVDGPDRPPDPATRRVALDRWQAELETGIASGRSEHPVIAALVDAGRRHDCRSPSCRRTWTRCAWIAVLCGWQPRAELDGYMSGSAGAVGLIMAPLLGAPQNLHSAVAELGTGIPADELHPRCARGLRARPGLSPCRASEPASASPSRTSAERRMTDGLRTLLAAEVSASSAHVREHRDPPRGAPSRDTPVGFAWRARCTSGVLDRVEALGFDVLSHPVRVSPWQLGAAAIAASSTPGWRRRMGMQAARTGDRGGCRIEPFGVK